ncbi:integral membrane protein [Metarhizium guizhouense ARSEF 977]|uniref:Integral membrane protein n=1 Tax=Metarhizium guizhouense (strain ARSEF 977) TaxID=1276136 RepID=A0A0B4GMA4_METGA|nr:integral membrane protein [Metarhizium guizhouense ARSEF 977]
MRPVVHALGGWCGHNFSSRKEPSAPSFNPVKLGHVRRLTRATYNNESTCNLAGAADSNLMAVAAESGQIYGQGEGSDTVISTGKAKEKLEPSTSTRSTDGAILVQYEIDLSFCEQYSHGR